MTTFIILFILIFSIVYFYDKLKNLEKTSKKLNEKIEHDLNKEFFCVNCFTYKPLEELDNEYLVKGFNYRNLMPVLSDTICKSCTKDLDPRMQKLLEKRADRIIKWKKDKEEKENGDFYSI